MRKKPFVVAFFILLLALFGLVLWMAGGIQSTRTFDEPPIRLAEGPSNTSTTVLTVVSWNIGWGYGWGSEGSGKAKPEAHFETSARAIGEKLQSLGADIALLQEVDFDSTRSHHLDQALTIAEVAELPFIARAVSWRANWVPFPYWPPSDHFGAMESGGAILSRFPIEANRVEWLEKPAAQPWWYNLFYLFRFLQTVSIRVGDHNVTVYNTHLEAFHQDNRMLQAKVLCERIAGPKNTMVILGGDFNSVPPEASTKSAYPDEPETDHEADETIALLRAGLPNLAQAEDHGSVPLGAAELFTFPSHAPNRQLDYIFVSNTVTADSVHVPREVGTVSDHLPIVARIRLTPVAPSPTH